MRGRYERRTWEYDPTLYAPARFRRACNYDTFLPDPLADFEPTLTTSTIGVVSDAERRLQRLGTASTAALGPLARLLLRTESIASSKVEGLQVDARDLARGEARADTGGKLNATTAEVLANVDAMELAIDEATSAEPFGRDQIVAIHRQLMTAAPNARVAGRIRKVPNWIGGNDHNPCGADFVPPPPEHVEPLLADLCDAMADESLPPLVQAALVHAQFETIHPFDDGNGRTGRTLIHVVLRRRGLAEVFVPPISVVFARDRDRYIDGLTAYRNGEVDGWIETFATATVQATDLAASYVDEVAQLTERWRDLLHVASDPRADAAAWAMIDLLPAHPVITAPIAGAVTGRAKAAVHNALDQLADAGVLKPVAGGRRNRSWEAAGLLDLIADLEAGELPT
ncbi:MAG: Fic family protein [Nitriliruptor sp.]|uniref:Fic family protein n=1 Tax=Nitriliruptor sp. TaxID=2448056 RepID=UPI0034A0A978